jgi:ribose transport system substrate-binding protein
MKTLRVLLCCLPVVSAFSAPARIGVLLKDRDVFWSAAERGAVSAAQAAGATVTVKAPLVPNALNQQLAMLAALAKEPLDALVIAPLTAADFAGPLAPLVAKGVKIVALDTPLPAGMAQAYVGYNQVVMAEAAAKHLAGLVGETDKVALLRAYSIEGMSVREKTLIAAFRAARPQAALFTDVVAGSEKQDDYAQSLLLLERHPDIRAVCTPFTAASLAMTRAIKAKGLGGKVLHVGFGTSLPTVVVEALESGVMQAWVAQQPKLIGSRGVEVALELTRGVAVAPTVDVPYFIVTKANLQEPRIQALRE